MNGLSTLEIIALILFLIMGTWASIYWAIVVWRYPDKLKVLQFLIKGNKFDIWLWTYRIMTPLMAVGFIILWILILLAIADVI